MAYRRQNKFNPFTPYMGGVGDILEKRNELLSYPLRKFGGPLAELAELYEESVPGTLGVMALAAYAAAPTIYGNILMPAQLTAMGFRPQPIVEGLSYKIHVAPKAGAYWLEPVFHTLHGASPAYKAGARVGGKVGGRIGARLIPGIGYGLLAYDVYDIAANRSLWGFDLS